MADSSQKTPFGRAINEFAGKKVADAIQLLGKALPCSVSTIPTSGVPIVTVKFEVQSGFTLPTVTVPVLGFEYLRFPVKVGDKGVVFPASVNIGNVSGLGGGNSSLVVPANLSALVFMPVGNAKWDASEDPNAVVLYGPDGVIIRDTAKTSSVKVEPHKVTVSSDTEIDLKVGAIVLKITAAGFQFTGPIHFEGLVSGPLAGGNINFGAGNIVTTGEVNGGTVKQGLIVLGTHKHTGVQTGGGTSGGPTP